MPNYKVTYQGDLGNLKSWDAAIRNTVLASSREIESANKRLLAQVGKVQGQLAGAGNKPGLYQTKLQATIDGVNRSMRVQGDLVRRVISDYEVVGRAGAKFAKPILSDQYVSSFKHYIADLDKYEDALRRIAPLEQKILRQKRTLTQRQAGLENDLTLLSAQKGQGLEDLANKRALLVGPAQAKYNATLISGTAAQQAAALKKLQQAEAGFRTATAADVTALQALDVQMAATTAKSLELDAAFAKSSRNIRRRKPYQDLTAAITSTPPVPANLAQLLEQSPSLRKNLMGGPVETSLGLGAAYGTPQFAKNLATQDAQITKSVKNFRTGVRTISGSLKDIEGNAQQFTIDIDKQGKVIGRWGGQLSGAGSILRQTVRDFQKVIEWTIATTLVFGSLAAVVKQLSSINELNTALTRLSITAQTTSEQTQKLFDSLSEVALNTATPLKDIVSVADDIALATKQAGDSTDEWRQKIVDLTTAVGIFTNLTGVDTVQAADQLSAAFKQLNVAPNELVGILSKVTAVAGGQSQAIADIVQALSTVSEAAKGAGLTIDEQIASVQVLAQVTNKSAADIATSFKNLFGSVSSVGSVKILKEFGIEVRDASGGVRNFLDIYRDVANALEKGIIPQNRLPDILRGLGGGPRRSPDVAALLENIGRIDATVGTSVNATNEALIANAKVLDTNQAKITQFQNSLDVAVFKTFGESVKEATAALSGFGTVAANAFAGIDPFAISIILKFGALLLAAKTLGGGFNTFVRPSVEGLGQSFVRLSAELYAAQGAMAKFSVLSGGSKFTALKAGKIGAIAGIGIAGAGALATGNQNDVGGALQTIGLITTLIPGLQEVGIAALVAGSAIQLFGGDSEKATKTAADLSSEVYDLTQSLKKSQAAANDFANAQRDSLTQVTELRNKTKLTADDQVRLSSETDKYVTATLGLASANRDVSKTFDDLLLKIPQLGEKYNSLKAIFAGTGVNPNSPVVQDLVTMLTKDILSNSGMNLFTGSTAPAPGRTYTSPIPTGPLPVKIVTTTGNPLQPFGFIPGTGGLEQKTIDFSTLEQFPQQINDLFGPNGEFGKSVRDALKGENLQRVQLALGQLYGLPKEQRGGITDERLAVLTDAIQKIAQASDTSTANAVALTQQQARIQAKTALGLLHGNEPQNATFANQLSSTLNLGLSGFKPTRAGRQGEQQRLGIQGTIADLFAKGETGKPLSVTEEIDAGRKILEVFNQIPELAKGGKDAINRGIVDTLKAANIPAQDLDAVAKALNVDLKNAAGQSDELAAALVTAKSNALSQFADRSLQLLIAKNSGQFDKNAAGYNTLVEQNVAARDSTLQLIDALGTLSDSTFVDLNNALSQVIGLQGLFISQSELAAITPEEMAKKESELAGTLIEAAVAAGVNADGISKIKDEVFKLFAALESLPKYKKIVIDVQTGASLVGAVSANALADQANKGSKSPSSVSKTIKQIIKEINNALRGGKGSALGQLPKGAGGGGAGGGAANKPGLLDIPTEILQSTNAQSLIAQAVKNARSLQSKVPGETAANRKDIVELLDGTKRVLETRGVGEEYLRRALDELTGEIKRQNDLLTKADTIRRIRVGAGSFAALANVPVNSLSGVSVGGPNAVNVTLNLNGTVLTPAQFAQFADLVAAALKRQLSN